MLKAFHRHKETIRTLCAFASVIVQMIVGMYIMYHRH